MNRKIISGRFCTGPPKASDKHSVRDLEGFGLVGIYMEQQDAKEGPDPNCQECKGTGVITLFTSSRECECVTTIQWAKIKESLEPRDFMEEFLLEPEF